MKKLKIKATKGLMVNILRKYLKYINHKTDDDYLFCNVFGQRLVKSTSYHMLYEYNKRRGVEGIK